MVLNTRSTQLLGVIIIEHRAQQNEMYIPNGWVGLDCSRKLQSIHFRRMPIDKGQIEGFHLGGGGAELFQGLSCTIRAMSRNAPGFQFVPQNLPIRRVMIHDQDMQVHLLQKGSLR